MSGPGLLTGVVLLGAFGPVARLAADGLHGRASVLALLAVGCALLVRFRPPDLLGRLSVLAIGIATPLATWATTGPAPASVMVIGIVAADAALGGRPLLSRAPRRSVGVAHLAVPLIVLAQVTWVRVQGHLVVVLLLAASLSLVEMYHRRAAAMARTESVVTGVVARAGSALASVLLFAAAVVLLYLPGSVGRIADRIRRGGSRESYWAVRAVGDASSIADAHRPFASAPPRARFARNAVGVTVVLVLTLLTLLLVDDRQDAVARLQHDERLDVFERARSVQFSDLASFRGVPFADELKAEQDRFSAEHLLPSEVGGYDVGNFSGRFTNVRGGVRRTIPPDECRGCVRATVWLSGGSAAFGLGQRDEHTIASELVRLALRDGIALDVVNLGVPGWTLHQEVQKVRARLDAGATPDIVVFHNGYNDVVGTIIASSVHGVHEDAPALLDGEDIRAFHAGPMDPGAIGSPERLGALAASKYQIARNLIDPELDRRGIDSIYVFQPDALASDAQFEVVAAAYDYPHEVRAYFDRALEEASRRLSRTAIDLRHLLDDGPPVFADIVHTNEAGARAVAEAIYPTLRRQVLTAASRAPGVGDSSGG